MFCGIDWSDDHHDVAVVDDNGAVIAQTANRQRRRGLRSAPEALEARARVHCRQAVVDALVLANILRTDMHAHRRLDGLPNQSVGDLAIFSRWEPGMPAP
jgi:hypothetical protein